MLRRAVFSTMQVRVKCSASALPLEVWHQPFVVRDPRGYVGPCLRAPRIVFMTGVIVFMNRQTHAHSSSFRKNGARALEVRLEHRKAGAALRLAKNVKLCSAGCHEHSAFDLNRLQQDLRAATHNRPCLPITNVRQTL